VRECKKERESIVGRLWTRHDKRAREECKRVKESDKERETVRKREREPVSRLLVDALSVEERENLSSDVGGLDTLLTISRESPARLAKSGGPTTKKREKGELVSP
jgi:hypothetical protein